MLSPDQNQLLGRQGTQDTQTSHQGVIKVWKDFLLLKGTRTPVPGTRTPGAPCTGKFRTEQNAQALHPRSSQLSLLGMLVSHKVLLTTPHSLFSHAGALLTCV